MYDLLIWTFGDIEFSQIIGMIPGAQFFIETGLFQVSRPDKNKAYHHIQSYDIHNRLERNGRVQVGHQ
ncbi:hypothetical protein D3C74_497660 [compost metagenome]